MLRRYTIRNYAILFPFIMRFIVQNPLPEVPDHAETGRRSRNAFFSSFNCFLQTAMELELDPSCIGQSFEKVGKMDPEFCSEKLHTKGPRVHNTQPGGKLEGHEGITSGPPGATNIPRAPS